MLLTTPITTKSYPNRPYPIFYQIKRPKAPEIKCIEEK